MRRREFIAGLGVAGVWPFAARAQQAMPVVGFLNSGSRDLSTHIVRLFRQGLGEAGFVEGRNIAIEYRWADGQYDRLPALADDLVSRQVAVIATNGPATLVAKSATAKIPIVFLTGANPVEGGLVTSLSRPGGNLTGVTTLSDEILPKRLELLHELMPTATVIAALLNPTNPASVALSRDLQSAARTLGLQLHILHASAARDFDPAFATLDELRAAGLVISADPLFNVRSQQLAGMTLRHAVPAIYQYRDFAAAGGLMSYGGSLNDSFRLQGAYVGRILKGEKPADLPVQQATKVELIINLKTAKTLGITFPQTLLARADEVIE